MHQVKWNNDEDEEEEEEENDNFCIILAKTLNHSLVAISQQQLVAAMNFSIKINIK